MSLPTRYFVHSSPKDSENPAAEDGESRDNVERIGADAKNGSPTLAVHHSYFQLSEVIHTVP